MIRRTHCSRAPPFNSRSLLVMNRADGHGIGKFTHFVVGMGTWSCSSSYKEHATALLLLSVLGGCSSLEQVSAFCIFANDPLKFTFRIKGKRLRLDSTLNVQWSHSGFSLLQ